MWLFVCKKKEWYMKLHTRKKRKKNSKQNNGVGVIDGVWQHAHTYGRPPLCISLTPLVNSSLNTFKNSADFSVTLA